MAGGLNLGSLNTSSLIPDTGVRVISDIVTCGAAEAGWSQNEAIVNGFYDDLDLLSQYEQSLNTILGEITPSQNTILTTQWQLEDLESDKDISEAFLEDYRQMLAGEGDADNTLLMQDQLNQQNIIDAQNNLAAYKDSSALELDSMIRQGLETYSNQRHQEAVANIYASATGSVVGSYGSAARRTRAAIRAFVGDDMRFGQEEDGVSVQGKAGDRMIGSYAKMMLSSKAAVKLNIDKLNSNIKAAQIAAQDYRDQMQQAAEENQTFMDRYDDTKEMYEQIIENERNNIEDLQAAALATIKDAQTVLDRVNSKVDEFGGEKTTWDELDSLYEKFSRA